MLAKQSRLEAWFWYSSDTISCYQVSQEEQHCWNNKIAIILDTEWYKVKTTKLRVLIMKEQKHTLRSEPIATCIWFLIAIRFSISLLASSVIMPQVFTNTLSPCTSKKTYTLQDLVHGFFFCDNLTGRYRHRFMCICSDRT